MFHILLSISSDLSGNSAAGTSQEHRPRPLAHGGGARTVKIYPLVNV